MKKSCMIGFLVLLTLATILSGCAANIAGQAKKSPEGGTRIECNDKVDNDRDGLIDLADPGCADKKDTSELNPAIECDDGRDNDGDGRVDSRDSGCVGADDNDESNCGDGRCEGGETPENCQDDCGPVDSCTDSDGGYVLDVKGTARGYYRGYAYGYTDYCNSTTILVEYFCTGNQPSSDNYNCPGSCGNGACE